MRLYSFGVLLWTLTSFTCSGEEIIHFRSGFTLQAISHTQAENILVLRIGEGSLEFPAADVELIEALPDSAKAPPSPAVGAAVSVDEVLKTAAIGQGLQTELVSSVATVESRKNQNAVSSKGALGLMQLMPATASLLGVDPADAQENAKGGAAYLRALLLQYHGNAALALAAYNAGPGAVNKFHGVPPYAETRKYVVSVLREYERQLRAKPETETAMTANKPSATN